MMEVEIVDEPASVLAPFSVQRHVTAESVWRQHLAPMAKDEGCDPRELGIMLAADAECSEDRPTSFDEMVGFIQDQGLWGFADTRNKIIHWWSDGAATVAELVEFFAHEIGHLQAPDHEDVEQEELKATVYQNVAGEAYALAIAATGDPT